MSIAVTVTSDFICPWCLIGHRRLARAIRALPADTGVEVRWQPFELNPDMPAEGMDRKVYRALKFGSWERGRQLDAQTVTAAHGDDVAFDYDAIEKTVNTFQAHRLMRFAQRHGVADALGKALLSAYFEQGRDIGNRATLAEIAAEQGLDRNAAATFLAGEEENDAVRAVERGLRDAGIRSVPSIDIEGEVISGAQPVEVFTDALLRAADRAGGREAAGGVNAPTPHVPTPGAV
ncbi:DsbA family oxidoreductase [Acerihabitans sp.]|uniref:DsbA family oxidoreductase n=1 Tax=Acerihabitans sp. TaxID=2811394 RepID=UPI002EDA5952